MSIILHTHVIKTCFSSSVSISISLTDSINEINDKTDENYLYKTEKYNNNSSKGMQSKHFNIS